MYASAMLLKDGYSVLCRNYVFPGGEVDIIATKEKYICFIEVKMRSASSGNVAAEAVDEEKLARIRTAIEHFFNEYRDNLYVMSLTPRIDVAEIYTSKGMVKKYNYIEGVE